MKTKRFLPYAFVFIFLISLLLAPFQKVRGQPIIIPDSEKPLTVFKLLERQTELDGKPISFQGEVIGQGIYEKQGVFVNLMDTEFNALGIFMDKTLVKSIQFYGRNGIKGDYIKVTGTFHKVCTQHGGDTDLHASVLEILTPGKTLKEPKIPEYKILISIFLLFLTFFLFTLDSAYKKPTKLSERNKQI